MYDIKTQLKVMRLKVECFLSENTKGFLYPLTEIIMQTLGEFLISKRYEKKRDKKR